jgi:2-oxoglutarate ferredoxin oxidoreductase subunit delta
MKFNCPQEEPMGKILVLNPDWCKGCGICVAFCPREALEIIQEKVSLKEDNQCILCGLCEQRCPDFAIFISESEKR